MLAGTDFGIVPGAVADQSKAVQAALDAAHEQGRPLLLPAGHIFVRNLEFPGAIRVLGQPGATMLVAWLDNPVGKASLANDLSLESVGFSGSPGGARSEHGLLAIESSVGVRVSNCQFLIAATSGLLVQDSAATIEDCTFDQLDVAIFSRNSRGLTIRGNRIGKCGNGGILLWRDQPGPDGSIVTGNHIAHVLAGDGGNGQNGNGINIFRADRVVIADNVVSDVETGIAVSVAAGVGPVRVAGNLISGARKNAIAGLRWQEVASPDLAADAARYPGVSVTGNTVAP
jgi:uncharacterized secreted repeat protein (TIGR03808 family)